MLTACMQTTEESFINHAMGGNEDRFDAATDVRKRPVMVNALIVIVLVFRKST